jgi:hypothetical protein
MSDHTFRINRLAFDLMLSQSRNDELASSLLEIEHTLDSYLFAKLTDKVFPGTPPRHLASCPRENHLSNSPVSELKLLSSDFTALDRFMDQGSLLDPSHQTKFLQRLEDGYAGTARLRDELVKSSLSDSLLESLGSLFLHFDDLQIQNHRLHGEAAELDFNFLNHKRPVIVVDDSESDEASTDESASQLSIDLNSSAGPRTEVSRLKAELYSINATGRKLLREKQALEEKIEKTARQAAESAKVESEKALNEQQREVVRLKAKLSLLRQENRRLAHQVKNGTD